jgi:hypothetical protein
MKEFEKATRHISRWGHIYPKTSRHTKNSGQFRVDFAIFGATWEQTRPGQRVFCRFCWDLAEVDAAEGALWPAANPGIGVFG